MRILAASLFFVFVFSSAVNAQETWLEGSWNVRALSSDPGEQEATINEAAGAISFSNFNGQQISFTSPGDDGTETQVFSVEQAGDYFQAMAQSTEGGTTDFELLRAFRIDADVAVLVLLSLGGNGELLSPIYYTDAVVALMSKTALPAALPISGRAGAYRGYSFGFEAYAGDGFQYFSEVVEADVTAAGTGYRLDPQDGEAPVTLSNEGNYLRYADFSEYNVNSSGDFESLLAFPISATEVVFLRLEGNGVIFDPFINFDYVNGEAGVLSLDPDFEIPDFIDQGGTWFAGAENLGGDWRWLPWLRSFNISQEPWIFHPQHGWLYPFGDIPAAGMFFWDARQASFLYTTSGFYPTMYRFSDSKWIRYQIGSSNPRWFVDLQTGVWETVE